MGSPDRRQKKNASRPEDRHRYNVSAWWSSGRAGLVKANGSPTAIHFAAPMEFGGMEERWTPEELLLAAVASCYTTTLSTLAAKAGVELTDLQVEVRTSLCRSQAGYAIDAIELRPSVIIGAAVDRERVLELIHKAEKLCLVSRSLSVPVRCLPQLNHGLVTSPL
jgi:peroxiredoxin-like protein